MGVRVTFAEVLVPGHVADVGRRPPLPPAEPETEVPSDVSVLELVGASWDPGISCWRVLARRYRDVEYDPLGDLVAAARGALDVLTRADVEAVEEASALARALQGWPGRTAKS